MAALGEDQIYSIVHRTTWKRRVAGMMAACTVGLALGALIGAAAVCLPWLVGVAGLSGAASVAFPALVGTGGMLHAAGVFGVAGGFLASALGTEVGANAGSVTAGILANRGLESKDGPALEQALTNIGPTKTKGPLFNPKVALVTGLMFAAFGALALWAAPGILLGAGTLQMLGLGGLGALGVGTPAALAAGTAIFGMFGATVGVNPPIAELSNAYSKLITGEVFQRAPQPEHAVRIARERSVSAPAPTIRMAAQAEAAEPEAIPERRFATEEKRFDPKAIIASREQPEVAVGVSPGR